LKKEITVKYGDFDLSPYFIVSSVTMPFLYKDNQYTQIGRSDGESLIYSRNAKTKITIQGTILTQETNLTVAETKDELINALKSDTVQQLTLSNYPGRYFDAIFDGSQDFDGTFDYITTVELVFTVPDGIAHSVATQTADNMPYKDVPVNMLTDSGFESGNVPSVTWGPSAIGTIAASSGGATLPIPFGNYMLKIDSNDTSTVLDQFVSYPLANAVLIKSGETWTYSYYYASAGAAAGQASDYLLNGGNANPIFGLSMGHGNRITTGGQTAWHRFTATFTATADTTVTHLRFGFVKIAASGHGWICIDNIKLEQEPTASPWSPNPADPEYYTDTITVTNSGTVPVPVKVTSQFSSDDGFLGLALNGRYYQVGNTKEVNGITYDDSQMLVKTRPTIDKYILNDSSFAVIPADQGVMTQTGSVAIYPDSSTPLGITTPSDFGPNNNGPHGPSLIYQLPADSNGALGAVNCILRMHAGLGALSTNLPSDTRQVGQICMTIYDANKNAMARILYSDMSQTKSDFTVRYDLNGTKVHEEDFSNTPGFTGHCYIRKSGSQFIFAWGGEAGGTAQTYTCEELADTKVMYVSFNFLQWADVPLPHYFGLIEWNFEKDYVDLYKDLPNYFKAGDIVTLDSSTNLLTINQYTDWDRVDIGSQPLLAPPGQSTLGIVVSPWANLPAVSTELREGWL
jgi:predicted phage tail component-like protein